MTQQEISALDEIISGIDQPNIFKIRLLQHVQKKYGYIKNEHLDYLAKRIGTTATDLYGIATFYDQFNLNATGRHMIYVCEGTTCHVKGGKAIREKLKELLGIEVRQTTADGRFSLKSARCLGCCGLAPVIMIDDKSFGRVKPQKIPQILSEFK